jgi:tRNA (guanine37-N1)-methyltransferase
MTGAVPPTPAWRATILTLFPDMFPGSLGLSLAGRALESGIWSLEVRMVMRADVLDAAIGNPDGRPLVYFSPRGGPLDQARIRALAAGPGVTLICGRYEGVDQRILDFRNVEEISIGDYVLSGGELPALVLLDACIRLLPGVMGAAASAEDESFSHGLLEYPHYTRPAEWQGRAVPSVLVSGNHAAIAAWRRAEAEKITRARRPDLWRARMDSAASAP